MPTLPRLPSTLRTPALAASVATLATLLGAASATAQPSAGASGLAVQAPVVCPATFHVLHDDRIGALQLPAGPYEVTVYGGLGCAASTDLFARFLEDWDGRLPRPWRLDVDSATFTRGSGPIGFSVRRVDSPHGGGGGRHPANGRLCPGTFHVLHDDRIGVLRLPAGHYTITLLSTQGMSCRKASRLFARFLEDYDGILPGRWQLDPQTATFRRGASRVGFRVKPSSSDSGGGGVHPRRGARCPGTFRVLHNDRIGRLRLPRGRYWITLLSSRGLNCKQASRRFTQFLDEDYAGVLPRPWVLNAGRAEFRRGRKSNVGFRVKPVRAL